MKSMLSLFILSSSSILVAAISLDTQEEIRNYLLEAQQKTAERSFSADVTTIPAEITKNKNKYHIMHPPIWKYFYFKTENGNSLYRLEMGNRNDPCQEIYVYNLDGIFGSSNGLSAKIYFITELFFLDYLWQEYYPAELDELHFKCESKTLEGQEYYRIIAELPTDINTLIKASGFATAEDYDCYYSKNGDFPKRRPISTVFLIWVDTHQIFSKTAYSADGMLLFSFSLTNIQPLSKNNLSLFDSPATIEYSYATRDDFLKRKNIIKEKIKLTYRNTLWNKIKTLFSTKKLQIWGPWAGGSLAILSLLAVIAIKRMKRK